MRSTACGIGLHFIPSHLQPSLASKHDRKLIHHLPVSQCVQCSEKKEREKKTKRKSLFLTCWLRLAARCETPNDLSHRFLNLTA